MGRSDVYSLGIVLSEMVTGPSSYWAKTPPVILVKHWVHFPSLPCTLNLILPEAVEQVTLKVLVTGREECYATATNHVANSQPA